MSTSILAKTCLVLLFAYCSVVLSKEVKTKNGVLNSIGLNSKPISLVEKNYEINKEFAKKFDFFNHGLKKRSVDNEKDNEVGNDTKKSNFKKEKKQLKPVNIEDPKYFNSMQIKIDIQIKKIKKILRFMRKYKKLLKKLIKNQKKIEKKCECTSSSTSAPTTIKNENKNNVKVDDKNDNIVSNKV